MLRAQEQPPRSGGGLGEGASGGSGLCILETSELFSRAALPDGPLRSLSLHKVSPQGLFTRSLHKVSPQARKPMALPPPKPWLLRAMCPSLRVNRIRASNSFTPSGDTHEEAHPVRLGRNPDDGLDRLRIHDRRTARRAADRRRAHVDC